MAQRRRRKLDRDSRRSPTDARILERRDLFGEWRPLPAVRALYDEHVDRRYLALLGRIEAHLKHDSTSPLTLTDSRDIGTILAALGAAELWQRREVERLHALDVLARRELPYAKRLRVLANRMLGLPDQSRKPARDQTLLVDRYCRLSRQSPGNSTAATPNMRRRALEILTREQAFPSRNACMQALKRALATLSAGAWRPRLPPLYSPDTER